MHLPFIASAHSCKLNVCDNNMFETQTYTLFYYSTDKCTEQWHCRVLQRMDYEQNTFPCYRTSQLRNSTRGLPFTTYVESIVISIYLNSVII